MDELLARLQRLEDRVTELERQQRGEARAPFRVVNAGGRTLLEVTEDERGPRVRLLGRDGTVITELGATPEGGALLIHNDEGATAAVLGTVQDGGFLDIQTEEGEHAAVVAAQEGAGHIYAFEDGDVDFNSDQARQSC
ncbi:MAG TPA: hypothetical protein VFU47_05390 [Armatimonadota bacterium]|nr:hypothetical protein [Armatimonadota bacterium]